MRSDPAAIGSFATQTMPNIPNGETANGALDFTLRISFTKDPAARAAAAEPEIDDVDGSALGLGRGERGEGGEIGPAPGFILGLAAAYVILTLFVVSLHILVWIFLFFAILVGVGFLIIHFPIAILISILLVEGIALTAILLFNSILGLGRYVRLRLSGSPPSSP